MTVDNPNVIDAIGTETTSGDIVLTIADHLAWDNEGRLYKLQAKINRYLDFIESGELLEHRPTAKCRRIRIEVVFKHPPCSDGVTFLTQAAALVHDAGYRLTWRVSNFSEYSTRN